jgi:hypothetical protein
MAYRKPGVRVTQEFIGLVPALAAFTLPSVTVGPGYQLVDEDALGQYAGTEQAYAYAGKNPVAVVDLRETASDDYFAATKKPVAVTLKNVNAGVLANQAADGALSGKTLTSQIVANFTNIEVGDIVKIKATTGVSVIGAGTAGETFQANPTWLQAASALFGDVKAGDTVTMTGGTNVNTGTYTVVSKVSDTLLILSGAINDGGGDSSDATYTIAGDRGTANAGSYTVAAKPSNESLVMTSDFVEDESLVDYEIWRAAGDVELERVENTSGDGFVPTADDITVTAGLTVDIGGSDYPIVAADVEADYRALRVDLASEVQEYTSIGDIEAVFGEGQITPQNPLAYGLSIMLQNTVTAVNGLGLDANYLTDEALSFTNSLEPLGQTDMYAIAVLSHSPVVHTTFKNHVEQMSLPEKSKERVALVNSLLETILVLADETTTTTELNGSRTIINTQVGGEANIASADTLIDSTPGIFASVQNGDDVTIVSGTNAILGTYSVISVLSGNNLQLSGNIISAGTASDFNYYIQRKDGLSDLGQTFYDRNATFLTNGVAPGHFLTIASGSLAGRYQIATVDSERQVTLAAAIPGVVEVTPSITYQVDRDLSKTEQAESIAGYSESLGSRRVVHCWPDVVSVPMNQSTMDVEGWYLGCTIAALTTGLPTQQGFTNLSVSGFLGQQHSSRYFSDDQMDIIADGGTMIFAQSTPSTPLYVRHQLTTNRSAIKFQEYSVTKNVDFIAKFVRDSYEQGGFIGKSNIVDTTLDELKTTGQGIINFLKEKTRLPRIGGVIRNGSLQSISEDADQIDTVNIRFGFVIPIPLNNLDIVIEV